MPGGLDMAERTTDRERLVAKVASLTDGEVAELLDYVNIMETMRLQRDSPSAFEDELVSLLADSRESRRARTVIEWDRVRRRAERAVFAGFTRGLPA
jgi:hypothetical protein